MSALNRDGTAVDNAHLEAAPALDQSASMDVRPDSMLVYLDAQFDHIQARVCSLAALAVAYKQGNRVWQREVIQIADAPPDEVIEERLLRRFADDLFLNLTKASVAQESEHTGAESAIRVDGNLSMGRVRLHFVHFDRAKPLILGAVARHYDLAAPHASRDTVLAFYDLLTRARSSEPGVLGTSATVTCIATDELPRRNCPVPCQSLQSVATWAGYHWPLELKRIFRFGHFDAHGRHAETGRFYCRRSRRSSQLPDEYLWAAWGRLPSRQRAVSSRKRTRDEYAPFRRATLPLLKELVRCRLAALAHLIERWQAEDAVPGRTALKSGGGESLDFDVARLAEYDDCCRTFVGALTEAVSLERRTRLAEWMSDHAVDPQTRALSGLSALARYHNSDQDDETDDRNQANREMRAAGERWSADGMRVVLRVDDPYVGHSSEAVSLYPFNLGDRVLVSPRRVCDTRLPPAEHRWHSPTARQLLYTTRAEVTGLDEERGEVTLLIHDCPIFNGDPYVFPSVAAEPFEDGQELVLDADPNDAYQYSQRRMLAALRETLDGAKAGSHPLYNRLEQRVRSVSECLPQGTPDLAAHWPIEAANGQRGFLLGLDALRDAGILNEEYDATDREYIGDHGTDPLLLVQGPPGTGKTQKTVWMMLARVQGAINAGMIPFRIVYSANTHAAVDVAAAKMSGALGILRRAREARPIIFARFFDPRLLDAALFRVAPHRGVGGEDSLSPHAQATESQHPTIPLDKARNKGTRGGGGVAPVPANADVIAEEAVAAIVFGTPGALYGMWKERWQRKGFIDRYGVGLLVVDECSRLTQPELLMAGVPLKENGALVAVGDPRQTAPIRSHDFEREPRRTFKRFPVAAMSVFDGLRQMGTPLLRFSRSWRCHLEIARFLSEAIYQPLDGINYQGTTSEGGTGQTIADCADPFLAAVLSPAPITLVLHEEASSEKENAFEAHLIAELLQKLPIRQAGDVEQHNSSSVGVVVPHRAQRRLIRTVLAEQRSMPTSTVTVDTVERFQGGERQVMILGATESDPLYLRETGVFFYDARRLCVALSRARAKVIVIASKNVFRLENASDEAFEGALLWQRLKRKTCTRNLWSGERSGRGTEVWATA